MSTRRQFLQTTIAAGAALLAVPKAALAFSAALITVERILAWKPCSDYPEKVFAQWIGAGKTPEEMTFLPGLVKDPLCNTRAMLWVLWRTDVFTEKELRLLLTRCMEAVLPSTTANTALVKALRRKESGLESAASAKAAISALKPVSVDRVADECFTNGINVLDIQAYLWGEKTGTEKLRFTLASLIAFRSVPDIVRVLLGSALTDAQLDKCLLITGDVLGGRIDLSADLGGK